MGMFDYVTYEGRLYQTHDTPDQYMVTYRIVNGRLIGDEWHVESVPWNERRYPLDKGLLHLAGSIRRVIDKADVDLNWHGYLELCADEGPHREYRAKFTDGNLVEFVCLTPEPAPPEPERCKHTADMFGGER